MLAYVLSAGSLVDRGYVEDLKYLEQVISTRVIELNRGRKKVILSARLCWKKNMPGCENYWLQENQVVKGIVRRLTQFGAFVDIRALTACCTFQRCPGTGLTTRRKWLKWAMKLRLWS